MDGQDFNNWYLLLTLLSTLFMGIGTACSVISTVQANRAKRHADDAKRAEMRATELNVKTQTLLRTLKKESNV